MKRLFVAALLLTATAAAASDAYFIRFNATGAGITAWADDVLFYNTNSTSVTVRFLGVSNGTAQTNTPPLELPARTSVSLNSSPAGTTWLPVPVPSLWVLHLDVPAGVIVESRDEFYRTYPGVPELLPTPRGKVSMPVFRGLRVAGEQQVHLGTDLSGVESRVNVGVFNAGTQTASATIEVRRTCDDVAVDTRNITIPPNTVIQASGFVIAANSPCTDRRTASWMRAVTITVDQPSVTFVSNVNDTIGQAPGEYDGLPVVGLAVTKSEPF